MKTFKKVLSILGNTVLLILIVIGIFVGITLLPIKNNFKLLAVMSGSMEPAIGVGSIAVIKPAPKYEVGDIITFKKSGTTSDKETTTHRINSVTDASGTTYFTTKGDANGSVDLQKVSQDQVVGKYQFGVALLGYALKYLKTLPGLILIIIIPATIIIYEEAKKIGRELKAIRTKNKSVRSPKKKEKK